jgi:perosamine synthetase
LIKDEGLWHQEVHEFGLNYRLPDVLCALGLSQLSRLSEMKIARDKVFSRYIETLSSIPTISFPTKREYVKPNWHLFPLRVNQLNRKLIFSELRKAGFGVQVNYLPAHLHPVLANLGFRWGDFPVAEDFYKQEISLPMWPGVDRALENYFEAIAKVISKCKG